MALDTSFNPGFVKAPSLAPEQTQTFGPASPSGATQTFGISDVPTRSGIPTSGGFMGSLAPSGPGKSATSTVTTYPDLVSGSDNTFGNVAGGAAAAAALAALLNSKGGGGGGGITLGSMLSGASKIQKLLKMAGKDIKDFLPKDMQTLLKNISEGPGKIFDSVFGEDQLSNLGKSTLNETQSASEVSKWVNEQQARLTPDSYDPHLQQKIDMGELTPQELPSRLTPDMGMGRLTGELASSQLGVTTAVPIIPGGYGALGTSGMTANLAASAGSTGAIGASEAGLLAAEFGASTVPTPFFGTGVGGLGSTATTAAGTAGASGAATFAPASVAGQLSTVAGTAGAVASGATLGGVAGMGAGGMGASMIGAGAAAAAPAMALLGPAAIIGLFMMTGRKKDPTAKTRLVERLGMMAQAIMDEQDPVTKRDMLNDLYKMTWGGDQPAGGAGSGDSTAAMFNFGANEPDLPYGTKRVDHMTQTIGYSPEVSKWVNEQLPILNKIHENRAMAYRNVAGDGSTPPPNPYQDFEELYQRQLSSLMPGEEDTLGPYQVDFDTGRVTRENARPTPELGTSQWFTEMGGDGGGDGGP